MTPIRIVIIFYILLLFSLPAQAQKTNYCHDPESWTEWDAMVAEYPEDIHLQILHALKIGLCVKISQDSISIGASITLFNDMVYTLANKRGEDDGQGEREL